MRDSGWSFVCRLTKNRRCHGPPLRAYRRHPSWAERGWLTGGVKVWVVRYGAQDYATTRLTLAAAAVRRLSAFRAPVEEVIRACKDQLGLRGCHARSDRAPLPHMTCCRVAFGVLERERHDRRVSRYQLKRRLSFKGRSMALSALERLRSAA